MLIKLPMAKCNTMLLVVCLLMVFLTLAHGTSECYQCVYVDGFEIDRFTSGLGIKSEKGCKKGNKLDDFAMNCSSDDSWTQMTQSTKNMSLTEGTSYTCGRLSIMGKLAGKNAEVLLRTCLVSNMEDWKEPCISTSVEKLVAGESDFSGFEEGFMKQFVKQYDVSEDTDIALCGCTGEKCNGTGTISGVTSVTIILAFVTKFFLML